MPILATGDYWEVRNALDISASAARLPDAVIGRGVVLGAAEDEVVRRVPQAASFPGSLTNAQQAQVKRATAYLAAANLVYAYPQIVTQSMTGTGAVNIQAPDFQAKISDLRSKAYTELNAVLNPSTDKPTFFFLASGKRGQ